MPGAWEIAQANSVLVGILNTEITSMPWSFSFRNLIIPGQVIPISGRPFDDARNFACNLVLQNMFQWLFFLDSDVALPRDAILRLIARNKPLISGLYCRRSPPHGVPVAIRNRSWVTDLQGGPLLEVDYVGAGCMLIHRSVLERLQPDPRRPEHRWFDWKVDCAGLYPPEDCLSEDFVFCRRVKNELGIPTILDTSVVCRHLGLAEYGYGSVKPAECLTAT